MADPSKRYSLTGTVTGSITHSKRRLTCPESRRALRGEIDSKHGGGRSLTNDSTGRTQTQTTSPGSTRRRRRRSAGGVAARSLCLSWLRSGDRREVFDAEVERHGCRSVRHDLPLE